MGSDEGGPQPLENVFNNALALTLEDVAHVARHIFVHLLARQEGMFKLFAFATVLINYYYIVCIHRYLANFKAIFHYLFSQILKSL
jgi:hypothetical protein